MLSIEARPLSVGPGLGNRCVMTFVRRATISGSLLFLRALGIRPANCREDAIANKGKKSYEQLPVLHPDAVGIDVGASEFFVAVAADRDRPDALRDTIEPRR